MQPVAQLRHTPLTQTHIDSGARMVEYAGWSMPVFYTSILEEARAVRRGVGIFDISHMGRTRMSGAGATATLQQLTTNDVAALEPQAAQYSLLTNPAGGIIDDIIVYREGADAYLVVINASNTARDLEWIGARAVDTRIEDMTAATAMIAVQGPSAPELVARLAGDAALLSLRRFQYREGTIAGSSGTFCRTGYTGEDGFELIVPSAAAAAVWMALHEGGGTLCGLGARDALRIEAGYPLYGHEIDDSTTPVEAGLMWVVKANKKNFIGRDVILQKQAAGTPRKLVGLVSADRQQARQGYSVCFGDKVVGTVTSGVFSPIGNCSIAMAYIDIDHAGVGADVEIAIRDKRIPARVCAKKSLLSVVTDGAAPAS